MKSYFVEFKSRYFFLFAFVVALSQWQGAVAGVDVSTCPVVEKRSNGNGQASLAAGDFRPAYSQNNPVAANVVGTTYNYVSQAPSSKTGNWNFYWASATTITNLPVITRCWIAKSALDPSILSPIVFGPPPPPTLVGNRYYASYAFYVQNMPNIGIVTFEFTDPQTNQSLFYCSYDLSSNGPTTKTISCAPSITTQPVSASYCGSGTASFSVVGSGYASLQWQVSANGTSGWTNLSNAGDYSGVTTSTLSVSNRTNHDGEYYQVILTGSGSCGTTTSNVVGLTAKASPTAVFAGSSSLCGYGSRTLSVNLTGTSPWTFSYTATPSTGGSTTTTVTGTTANPTNLSVSPSVTTTYTITAVSDKYCSNASPTGNTVVTVNPLPTVTPTNASVCNGASTFSLAYSTTNSPNQYSIITGTRAMSGFSAITNASLTASPMSITIPSNASAGTYDFYMTVRNSVTGCVSAAMPFTVTVAAAIVVTANASNTNICSGSSVNLSAAGATTYSWTSTPSGFTSTSATPSVSPTTTTTYSVVGTSNGCSSPAATITVNVSGASALSITPSSSSICSGDRVSLTASGANTYSWTGPSSYTGTGNPIVVSPSATGTYTVTGTSAAGCTATASQTITVTSSPTVSVSGTTTVCSGSGTSLTASGATTYSWTPSTGLSATTGATVTATPSATTTYTVYGTTGSCTGSTTVTVTVTNPVTVAPPSQVLYCSGDLNGSNTISFSFTASSSVTCNWESNTTNTWPGTAITSTSGAQLSRSEAVGTSLTTSTLTVKSPGSGPQYIRLGVTSGTCTVYYVTTLVSLTGTPVFNIANSQVICSGTAPAQLASNTVALGGTSGVTYTYKWQSSTDSTTWSDIASTNSTSYQPPTLSANTWYRWAATGSAGTGCAGTWFSQKARITIATTVGNNTISIDSCLGGGTITGSTPTGGTGSFTYQWQSSTTNSSSGFSNIVGAVSQNYTAPIVAVTTWYRRLVSSGSCTNFTSNVAKINPPITTNQISNGQTLCSGSSITALSTSPAGGSTTGSYSYLWYSSTNNSSYTSTGTTTSSYSPPSTTGTNYYKVEVTRDGCKNTSNYATIKVNALPTITASPSSATVCSGFTKTITASGANSYTWSPSTDLNTTSGAVVITTPTASRTYTVTGTDANGCVNTATSTITYAVSPSTPTISSASSTICSNSTYSLTGNVTSGGTTNWYTAPEANASYLVASPGSLNTAGTYYAFASSGSCVSASYATFTLSVDNVAAATPTATSINVCSPNTTDLTLIQPANTSSLQYEWHTASSNPTVGNLVASPSTAGAGTYYLYTKSVAGSCYGTASTAVTVTSRSPATPSVTTTSLSACTPSTISITNDYTSTVGYTYGWYSTRNPILANYVANTSSISTAGKYYLYATDVYGCTSNPDSVTLTFNTPATVSVSSPSEYCSTAQVGMKAATTGTISSYTWQVSTDYGSSYSTVSNSGVYSGATSDSLSISSVTGLAGNLYRCIVTASNGCTTTSNGATMVQALTPSVTLNPRDTMIVTNSGVFLIGEASNAATASYQWYYKPKSGTTYTALAEGNPYTGTTTGSLYISPTLTLMDSNKYLLKIYTRCDTVSTTAAMLRVYAPSLLPITWIDFHAEKLTVGASLYWTTAQEVNSQNFRILRSNDAKNWTSIGEVPAASNSSRALNYQFTDRQAINGVVYYRVVLKDNDGVLSYSPVAYLNNLHTSIHFNLYPNPVNDNKIWVEYHSGVSLVIFNTLGEKVKEVMMQQDRQEIDLSELSQGAYLMYVEGQSKHFIKQ